MPIIRLSVSDEIDQHYRARSRAECLSINSLYRQCLLKGMLSNPASTISAPTPAVSSPKPPLQRPEILEPAKKPYNPLDFGPFNIASKLWAYRFPVFDVAMLLEATGVSRELMKAQIDEEDCLFVDGAQEFYNEFAAAEACGLMPDVAKGDSIRKWIREQTHALKRQLNLESANIGHPTP